MRRLMGLILLSLMIVISVSAQEGSTRLVILDHDADDIQDISLDLLVIQNGEAVPGIPSNNFSVSEPSANLVVTESTDRQVAMVILVDLTNGGNINIIRSTLRAYVDNYYQPDDILVFYLMDNTTPRRVEVGSQEEATSLINGLSISTGTFAVNDALPRIASELSALAGSNPNVIRHALLVGSYMYRSGSDGANSIPVPINVVQATGAGERTSSTADMQRIATATGGTFLRNDDGIFSPDQGSRFAASGVLESIYNRVTQNRTYYELSYRSVNQNIDPLREVSVTVQLPGGSLVSGQFSYEPSFEPPTVEFVNTNFTPSREFMAGGDNTTFDNPEATITLAIDFPDDVPRRLSSVRVEVLDATTGTSIQTITPDSLTLDADNHIELIWNLRGFNTPASTTQLVFRANVEDELGLTASTQQSGEVRVAQIPPTNTPVPTNTTVPTNTPIPTNTPVPVSIGGMEVDTETAAPVILILSGGVVVLAILAIFLLFTRPGKAIVQQGAMFTKTMVAGATQIFGAGDSPAGGSPFGPSTPTYGELQVLQGMNQGQIIPINRERFVLGRELAAGCDYVIPQPFVSSKHCEIATRGNQTWIQDLGSSNRTYVDGVPLNPHQEVQLRDGATIGISSHIQIRFNAPQPVQSTGGWGSKKTQLDFSQSTQLDTGYKPPMEQPTRLDMKPPMEHPTQINMPGKPPLEQPTQINMQPPPKEEPTQIFSKPPMEQPTQINFSPPTTPEPSSGWMDDPTQLPEDTLPDGIDPDTQYSKDRGLEGNRPSQGRRNPDDFDLPGDNDHPPVKDDWEI